ncbi:DUF4145 domain-containing protein [Nocardia cyriacigeorgica]|uniref:DUF4145 domain-containing protein n=2 Tax=Nocardia cyriacigeorgica TaxID=135487 RepID=A0A5R8PFK0_9NOCA|nr:DUF4145 domain-containing protein [Nocardia cyriacigeorgica]
MGFKAEMAMRSCGHCGLKRAQMSIVHGPTEARRSNGSARHFTILVCPDCAGVTVVEHTSSNVVSKLVGVWPDSPERALDVDHLPDRVARYYASARKALDAGIPDAAAVQLRRTLEAAADEYDVSERVLVRSIERLIAEGHVTKTFGDVLHLIRTVGNLGAHASDEDVDNETAQKMLTLTTQILRNLFEVPEELRLLKEPNDDDSEREA